MSPSALTYATALSPTSSPYFTHNAVLLKKAAGVTKGSKIPHTNKIGTVTRAQLEEIASMKMPDLTAANMDAAVRTIAGSARTMGVSVEGI